MVDDDLSGDEAQRILALASTYRTLEEVITGKGWISHQHEVGR